MLLFHLRLLSFALSSASITLWRIQKYIESFRPCHELGVQRLFGNFIINIWNVYCITVKFEEILLRNYQPNIINHFLSCIIKHTSQSVRTTIFVWFPIHMFKFIIGKNGLAFQSPVARIIYADKSWNVIIL